MEHWLGSGKSAGEAVQNSALVETKPKNMASNKAMRHIDNISRRDLIKMMTLTGAAMCRPISLLGDVIPGQVADKKIGKDQLADHPPALLQPGFIGTPPADTGNRCRGG